MNINQLIKAIENSEEYKECSSDPLPVKDRDIKLVNAFMLMLEKQHVDRDEYIEKLRSMFHNAMGWVKVVNGTLCLNINMDKKADKYIYVHLNSNSAAYSKVKLSISIYIPTIEEGFDIEKTNETIMKNIRGLIDAGPVLESIGILEHLLKELPKLTSKK